MMTYLPTFIHLSICASKMAEVCSQYIRWCVQLGRRELCHPLPSFFFLVSSKVSEKDVPSDAFLLRLLPLRLLQ